MGPYCRSWQTWKSSDELQNPQASPRAGRILQALSARPSPPAQARSCRPVQVDVKHLKRGAGRFFQFTAINEASRYRVPKIYAQSSIPNAIAFIEEVRCRLPVALQRVQTDHGNEFGAISRGIYAISGLPTTRSRRVPGE